MVQRHLGRVVGDDAAGAERGGVGVQPPEVVEPELRVEAARIVLDQRQLHPAHRPVEPAGHQLAGRAASPAPARPRPWCDPGQGAVSDARGRAAGHAQKVASGGVCWHAGP